MGAIKGISVNSQNLFVTNENSAKRQSARGNIKQNKSRTVFAGNLNMGKDSILAKKQKAQREAMKMISDVFQSDWKTDAEQGSRLSHMEALKKENAESTKQLKDIQDTQDKLMKEYGITADSEEQRDLELVRKIKNAKDPFAKDNLTAEEKERYEKIQEKGLTEYQERVLALDKDADEITSAIKDNQKEISVEESEYKAAKMQRLKENPMVGVKRQAEKQLEAARKEMIGGLYNEAIEYIEEKAEEAKEEQKKKQEAKQEEEEKKALQEAKKLEQEISLQKAEENAQERVVELEMKAKSRRQTKLQEQAYDAGLKDVDQSVDESARMSQEMKDLLDKMKLLQEDLKGAAVDNML